MAIAMLDHHRQAIRKRATDVIGKCKVALNSVLVLSHMTHLGAF
jgi:hypothetical protein